MTESKKSNIGSAMLSSVKHDVYELVKVFIISAVCTGIFYWIFKNWALTVIFFFVMYSFFFTSSYLVTLDHRLRRNNL